MRRIIVANPSLSEKMLMYWTKSVAVLATFMLLGVVINGCAKSDEKKFSVTTNDESGVNYQLDAKYIDNDNMSYVFEIKPRNIESFLAQINKKRHVEIARRSEVYNNLEKYCKESKIQSICDSLNKVAEEINVQTVEIIYTVKLYDRKGGRIDAINCSVIYNSDEKNSFVGGGIKIENQLKMSRAAFDDIKHVEVETNL